MGIYGRSKVNKNLSGMMSSAVVGVDNVKPHFLSFESSFPTL
jgi:hypothetical protein